MVVDMDHHSLLVVVTLVALEDLVVVVPMLQVAGMLGAQNNQALTPVL